MVILYKQIVWFNKNRTNGWFNERKQGSRQNVSWYIYCTHTYLHV